jgi:hypothetical protein
MAMKKVLLLSAWLIASGLARVAFGVPAGGGGDDSGPSDCLVDATIRVNVNPAQVQLGQPIHLTWSVSLPDSCSVVRVQLNGEAVARTGSRTLTPPRSTIFTLAAIESRLGQSVRKTAVARVNVAYPPRVVIDGSTPNPADVLIGALVDSTNPTQVVELCNVDLDFTGRVGIVVGANRSLIASPACARGPRSLGPRIFVTDKRGDNTPLFEIRDSNVLFSGFRLQGPTSDIGEDANNRETGIWIYPFASPDPLHDVEISNMEIFNWSGEGINVGDNADVEERGRLTNQNVAAVHIRNNFFHHNRHFDGYGYGVDVEGGAYALIEQNVFDENRHAIAGGSGNHKGDWSGYTARDNLILAGGGVHCGGAVRTCWYTHQIDMHGDVDSILHGGEACCGTAGETILMERNTVLYTAGYAIKIRGNPVDKAVADGNVFKHKNRDNAIAQNGSGGLSGDNISNPIQVLPNNAFDVDPGIEFATCDFFGDGQQDQFMATGVTWWARSPTTHQWRYLNTMPERLSQLQLRKVDGDAVCDVAPKTSSPLIPPEQYSKGGTGPWVPFFVNRQ